MPISPTALNSMRDELQKLAEQQPEPALPPHPLKSVGKAVLGYGAGLALGHAAIEGTHHLLRRSGRTGLHGAARMIVPHAVPLANLLGAVMLQRGVERVSRDHAERKAILDARKNP